jgi:aerobic-type carbon monoxide dehydrogenase small subunit (CoxS/CutS family)
VRVLALACIALLGGCIIDNDRLRIESFAPNPDGTFVFTAQTNTVMTENEDGEAEQIRRDWLAEDLTASGMCTAGYVIEIRRLIQLPDAPESNAHDVVYTGRCL